MLEYEQRRPVEWGQLYSQRTTPATLYWELKVSRLWRGVKSFCGFEACNFVTAAVDVKKRIAVTS
jgi:hypothetical protein